MLINSYSTQNLGIPNSIILNNFSIQNLIIAPNELESYYKSSISPYENSKQKENPNSFSSSPKKSPLKNFNSLYFTPINFYQNDSLLNSNANYTNINNLRISSPPLTSKNKKNPKIIPIAKKIFERGNITELHPKDSINKNKIKNNFKNNKFNEINISRNKTVLTNSISQKNLKNSRKIFNFKNDEEPFPRNSLSKKKKIQLNTKIIYLEPKNLVNLKEYLFGEQIGKGTFGKIFSVKWNKNNQYYAMKKEILNDFEDVKKRKKNCSIIQNFVEKTNNKGVINLYGNLCFKNKNKINIITCNFGNEIKKVKVNEYIYYELMEKAERDWDKEINIRSQYELYYTEKEIMIIINQLISTLSLLEKFHITHRDIKPQNILISNGQYKLCDFGEIRVLKRDGLIVQRVRGSELYMSPILFAGLHNDLIQVKHNTYKSDVFSLGMCLFYACSLTYGGVDSIRELNDMNEVKSILFNYLRKRYSEKLILLILLMLEVDENKRPNFIQLEELLKNMNIN